MHLSVIPSVNYGVIKTKGIIFIVLNIEASLIVYVEKMSINFGVIKV